jgi:mono/diheme cytochrome c family protein
MRMRRVAGCLLPLVCAALSAVAMAAQTRGAAGAAQAGAGRVEPGRVLYKSVGCYQCHSDEAQGSVHGPRLGPNPVAFARFSSYVRNPTAQMPPYTSLVLSDQNLADIYAFVAARPTPPAVASIPLLAR